MPIIQYPAQYYSLSNLPNTPLETFQKSFKLLLRFDVTFVAVVLLATNLAVLACIWGLGDIFRPGTSPDETASGAGAESDTSADRLY